MSISIQLGTKDTKRFTHKIDLQEDFSKFPTINIFFGIGQMQEQNTEFFPVQSPNLFLRILELASFDGNIIDFDFFMTTKSDDFEIIGKKKGNPTSYTTGEFAKHAPDSLPVVLRRSIFSQRMRLKSESKKCAGLFVGKA